MTPATLLMLTALGAVGAAGCATPPKSDAKTEEAALRALDEQFGLLGAKQDVAGVVALYASDATMLPLEAPSVKGTAAIREFFAVFLKTPGLIFKVVPEKIDIASAGDVAADMGRFEVELDSPQGHVKETLKYVEVWKKQDGQWKLYYDIWNSNAPAAPPEPTRTSK